MYGSLDDIMLVPFPQVVTEILWATPFPVDQDITLHDSLSLTLDYFTQDTCARACTCTQRLQNEQY